MNLYIRVLFLLISSFFKPKIKSVLETSVIRQRVWPNDLDFNMHMNNGRYLTVMDLGRLDLFHRARLMQIMMKQKSVPSLGAATIRYRLPLNPFQRFELHTRLACWDEKWAYIEQKFILSDGPKKGAIAAIAIVKGSFYDQNAKRTVPTDEVLRLGNLDIASPDMPEHILEWRKSEQSLRNYTK